MSQSAEPPRGVQPGDILLVVHNFDARGADELTLRRGDKVELLELDDGFGDGWYLGRHMVGSQTGLFPGVYTTSTSQVELKNAGNPAGPPAVTAASQLGELDEQDQAHHEPEPVSPVSNHDITPQTSRHVSAAEFSSSVLTEPEDETDPRSTKGLSRSSSPASTSRTPEIQRTISQTIVTHLNGEDSPVLNETLSVIDEHITNFSTPRQSVVAQEPRRGTNDSGSEYSSHAGNRLSYIHGAETDEEEERRLTETDVRCWDHEQVAEHLRELGVDSKHCEIFKEQEITGDVLLEMDQEFIYMKDFDFGVMGRRLKTWHIIKAFQEEIKGIGLPRQSLSTYPGRGASPVEYDRSQSRAATASSFLPRIPSVDETRDSVTRKSRGATFSSYQGKATSSPVPPAGFSRPRTRDSASRPSPDFIRQSNYHRRHSSIDEASRTSSQTMKPFSAVPSKISSLSHGKKLSLDKGWTMTAVTETRPGTALGTTTVQRPDQTSENSRVTISERAITDDSPDTDRGYFSGGEVDARRSRNVLRKRDSGGRSLSNSRQSSTVDDAKARHTKRHSRFSSVDSFREFAPYFSAFGKSNHAVGSAQEASHRGEVAENGSHSPSVTNLEGSNSSNGGFLSSLSSLHSKPHDEHSCRSSPLPLPHSKGVAPKFRRAIGLRAISDAVTGNEKAQLNSTSSSPVKDLPKSPARTNSTTPSGTSKSSEMEGMDVSSKVAETGLPIAVAPKMSSQRSKSKRDTSAYIRGLEKKSPEEQMIGCDYYGWMKKKSSNLMTTWKPRLFILRGRRLSYYYSEDDTEERGLIDISSHRVFRADNDTITSLHATITRAKASPTSPTNSSNSQPTSVDSSQTPGNLRPKSSFDDQPFIFKLVPPKAGLSRAVQFTKPTVHYFQVDNIQQGRLWMAALMKATIERDLNLPVTTTNKQKTVSLRQARLMNQRPPALMNIQNKDESKTEPEANDPLSNDGSPPLLDTNGNVDDLNKAETVESEEAPPSRSYST
ncbi:polar growth protein [Emydomyces testavorans]|uniref:Polar growth protein n=1 Tax=Emydomyces testavorans TaxID=2070801 RepID=A0AAF0DHR8_9EURO|nr:polar growth protein [Emydomyces testavorans]